jgi:hypothetical protein
MGRIWIMRQICVILVCHEYGHVWVEEYDLLYSLQLCACLIYVICVCLRIEVSSPRFLLQADVTGRCFYSSFYERA